MFHANWRSAPPELITPQEITAIMRRAGDIEDVNRALAVAREYAEQNGAPVLSCDTDFLSMLSNVYQAGRLQGIREQKARYRK